MSGQGRVQSPETITCSYSRTNAETCCWHFDRPSEWVVTLVDDKGNRCEHHVCEPCAHAAQRGDLPEWQDDQTWVASRIRVVPSKENADA